MDYAITTLEIEIARITKSLREIRETPFSAADYNEGFWPDIRELGSHIQSLKKAIKILSELNEEEMKKRIKK